MHNKLIFLNNHKIYYLILLSLVFLIVSSGVLYSNIDGFEKRLKNMLLHKSITHLDETLTNVIDDMVKASPNFIRANLTEKNLRVKNEETLNLLDTNDIKSLYVLFISNNRLFFLLDTADTERSNFKEAFIPEDESYFNLAIKEQVKQLFIQDEVGNLGFTLLNLLSKIKKPLDF